MLAYVFWHWANADVTPQEYEGRLRAFHLALQTARMPGFAGSSAARMTAAPWAPSITPLYEDWYLVEDFAALGALNEVAVTAAQRAPHDDAAQAAAGGMGGVYRLRLGDAIVPSGEQQRALWFAKPSGMRYDALLALLQPAIERTGGAFWQRQMTLGPAPEFCWRTDHAPTDVPEGISPTSIAMTPIY